MLLSFRGVIFPTFVALLWLPANNVQAVTQPATYTALLLPEQPFDIDDLLIQDSLGYRCIPELMIDIAFHATGKGARLPRTCLPEPCNAALEPTELAMLIGRQPTVTEWDDYFSRYADVCRKEVVPFKSEETPTAGTPSSPLEFWAPLFPPTQTAGFVPSLAFGGNTSFGGGGIGGGILIGGGGGGEGGLGSLTDGPDNTEPYIPNPPVSPVPLPAALWLLMLAVGSLIATALRRRGMAAR